MTGFSINSDGNEVSLPKTSTETDHSLLRITDDKTDIINQNNSNDLVTTSPTNHTINSDDNNTSLPLNSDENKTSPLENSNENETSPLENSNETETSPLENSNENETLSGNSDKTETPLVTSLSENETSLRENSYENDSENVNSEEKISQIHDQDLTENKLKVEDDSAENNLNVDHELTENKLNVDEGLTENNLNVEEDLTENNLNVDGGLTENELNVEEDSTENNLNVDGGLTENKLNVEEDSLKSESKKSFADSKLNIDLLKKNGDIDFNEDIDDFLNDTKTDKNGSLEEELLKFTKDLHKSASLSSLSDEELGGDKKKSGVAGINKEALAFESDFLTRRIQEGRDSENYLKAKLADKERELEKAENKIKDSQIRLIRFAKDDEAKDKTVAALERELQEMNKQVEDILQNNAQTSTLNNEINKQSDKKQESKFCVLL